MSKTKVYSDEEQSPIDSPPSSPPSDDSSKSEDGLSSKEVAKIASKSFGYIQRSIELLGRDSTRLAGARDFSNTLHWTQAMKFLKERGFIYTKTGHGTSVAEQFSTLSGLEKAFQEQFQLENFPLPRLSKTHMEKMEPKNIFDDASKAMLQAHYDMAVQSNYANLPYQFGSQPTKVAAYPPSVAMMPVNHGPSYPSPIYRAIPQHMQQQQQQQQSQMVNMIHTATAVPYANVPMASPATVAHVEPLTPVAHRPMTHNDYPSPSVPDATLPMNNRKLSFDAPPQCPLPTDIGQQSKPPTVSLNPNSSSVSLPSIANLTSSLRDDKPPVSELTRDNLPNTSSNNSIQSIIHTVPQSKPENNDQASQLAQEALHTLRQKAADAMLLQNFYEQVSELTDDQKKRSLPPPTSGFVGQVHKEKKMRVEFRTQKDSEWVRHDKEVLYC